MLNSTAPRIKDRQSHRERVCSGRSEHFRIAVRVLPGGAACFRQSGQTFDEAYRFLRTGCSKERLRRLGIAPAVEEVRRVPDRRLRVRLRSGLEIMKTQFRCARAHIIGLHRLPKAKATNRNFVAKSPVRDVVCRARSLGRCFPGFLLKRLATLLGSTARKTKLRMRGELPVTGQ